MKTPQKTAQEKILERNPEIYIEIQDGENVVILPTKSGKHPVGRGKDEDAAWKSCLTFYGLK